MDSVMCVNIYDVSLTNNCWETFLYSKGTHPPVVKVLSQVHNITTISTSDEGLPLALDLNTVTLQQAGQYYCVSNNGYHEGSSAFTLTVYSMYTHTY